MLESVDGGSKEIDSYEELIPIFQERIHLDHDPNKLNMKQVEYLCESLFYFELCRIARAALDNPKAYNHINLMYTYDHCSFLNCAANIGDLELLKRLVRVPGMDSFANYNDLIETAARRGKPDIVEFLLKDPRVVDPSRFLYNAVLVVNMKWSKSYFKTLAYQTPLNGRQ
jgi:hypothetical protein